MLSCSFSTQVLNTPSVFLRRQLHDVIEQSPSSQQAEEKPLALVKGFSMSSTRFTGKNVINNDIEREYIDPRDNG